MTTPRGPRRGGVFSSLLCCILGVMIYMALWVSFVVIFFAGMANHLRRNQPRGRPTFPWYSLLMDVAPEVHARWNAKLELMKKRKVHVTAFVDRLWMGQIGLMEAMETYLDKVFNGVHGLFMCLGWRQIFEIQ